MRMTKLASLFLTATLSLASGAALAAESSTQSNNGQANAAADAGQVAPDAKKTWLRIMLITTISIQAARCCIRMALP